MAYVTDGSVHHGGLSNEQRVVDFLNSIGYYPEPVVRLGGTKHKADAVAGDKGISIKRKARASQGSFDYLNTSQLPASVSPYFADALAEAKEIRGNLDLGNQAEAVARVRAHINRSSAQALNELTDEQVTQFLTDALITRYKPIALMAVTDADRLNLYAPGDNPVVQRLSAGEQFGLTGTARGSRRVPGTNLRVRLTLNNGVNALLGLSSKNKSSIPTIKLQQDNVPALLRSVSPQVFDMNV